MEWPFNQRKQRKGRQAFSPAEDDLLRKLVEKHGENNWAEVAEHMPHRNSRQCRDRWRGYLRPTLVNSQWLPEEDQILLKKYEEFGPKWSVIGHYIPGRSEINIKNRWKLLMQYCSMVPQRQQPNGTFPVWQTPSQIYQHYQQVGVPKNTNMATNSNTKVANNNNNNVTIGINVHSNSKENGQKKEISTDSSKGSMDNLSSKDQTPHSSPDTSAADPEVINTPQDLEAFFNSLQISKLKNGPSRS